MLLTCISHTIKAAIENDGEKNVPSSRNILALRKLGTNQVNDSYIYFCEKFLKCIVGAQTFSRGVKNKCKLSVIATPSDEALALLFLENSEYKWSMDFEKKKKGEEVDVQDNNVGTAPTKYTCAGQNKQQKGFTRKYGGWKNEGIERFNEILKMVRQDRIDNGAWFDEIMLQRAKEAKPVTENAIPGGKKIKAGNDLFDEEEVEIDENGGSNDDDDDDDADNDKNEDDNDGDHGHDDDDGNDDDDEENDEN